MKDGSKQHNAGSPARVTIPVSPVDEARHALDQHELSRPDYLKATRPNAPDAERLAWERWRDAHTKLRTALDIARTAERVGWRDKDGNPVTPDPWKATPTTRAAENRAAHPPKDKAAESRAYRARKAEGTVKATGKPRSDAPSINALKKRAQRERRKAA